MAYVFRDRLDHVGDRMKVLNYEIVSYRRGATTISGLNASPVRTDNQELIPKTGITNIRNVDWIFTTADLVMDGGLIEPEYGDEVIRANGERFQVCAFAASTLENESPFSYITSKRTRMRVHTEHIE